MSNDHDTEEQAAPPEEFRTWVLVELFGHQTVVGYASERTIAGHGFVQVNIPGSGMRPPMTRIFGPKAIYCITPISEEIAQDLLGKAVNIPSALLRYQQTGGLRLPDSLADPELWG